MPLMKLPIMPGVFKDITPLDAEGYAIDATLMRIREKRWQTIGGWEVATIDPFIGIARGGHAWADLSGTRLAAWGTAAKLYAFYGGSLRDITPEQKAKGTLVGPFSTVNGSTIVTVRHPNHGLKGDGTAANSDTVTYTNADPVGGLTLNGAFLVEIVTPDSYRIVAGSAATSTATGGGAVEYTVPFDAGLVDGIGGLGYGSGPYGSGPYGVAVGGDIHARVWSLANFGQLLMALPTNGALYEYQPYAAYPELVKNGGFDTDTEWVKGTGWTISGGKAVATAGTPSDHEEDLTGVISGGVTYVLKFDVIRTAGSFQFQVESAASDTPVDFALGETVSKSGTYIRRVTLPPNPTKIKFAKDADFAGSVDNVSLMAEDVAYRVQDAPPYARHMIVDPNGFVVLFGTVLVNGEFSALGVRWSDQKNSRTWTPNTDVQAGENSGISVGSEIRGALASRGQNLVWTDAALYTMRYVGSPDQFRFDFVGSGAGLIHKNAATEHNGTAFWWSSANEFKIFQGSAPQTIPCPLLRDVMDNLAPGQESKISCGVNAANAEVWWCYPDRRDNGGNNLECSRIVVYNWVEGCWYTHRLARSQWISDGVFANPIGLSPDGRIYLHELNQSDNGNPLSWELETADYDIGDGDRLAKLLGFIPDFDDQIGAVNFLVGLKDRPNSPIRWKGPYAARTDTRKVDFIHTARTIRFRFYGTSAPAFVSFGANKLDIIETGASR